MENAFDVNACTLACPHLVLLVGPVSAFQEDMMHCLVPIAALAFICVGLVDSLKVSMQANLACAHLCDD
jgi:hypothetical protein